MPVAKLLREIYRIWITERPSQFAAALAYYGIFAFVPIAFISLAVAGVFLDEIAVTDQLLMLVNDSLGAETATLLEDALQDLSENRAGGTALSTIISSIALLSAASLMFFQLQFALNTIWRIPPPTRGETRTYIVKRSISFLMVLGVGLFLVAASVVTVLLNAFTSFFDLDALSTGASALAHYGLLTFGLAALYKLLPDAQVSWRDLLLGSAVTAAILAVGLQLLSWYLSWGSFGTALEAAGAIAIVLLSFFIVGQIFVFGAVFIRVVASTRGAPIVPHGGASESD